MRLTQAEVVCDEFKRNEMYLLGMIILINFFSFEKNRNGGFIIVFKIMLWQLIREASERQILLLPTLSDPIQLKLALHLSKRLLIAIFQLVASVSSYASSLTSVSFP